MRKVDPKVEEAIETLNMKDSPSRRKLLTGTGLVSAGAAASALLAACGSSKSGGSAKNTVGDFPSTPPWKFTFVNHVTTNPFFVPTQYGLQDAASLLGLPKPAWTGSATSNVPQMVSAVNAAMSAKANGIAVAVISSTAFTTPVKNAMNAGIPVVSYNADGNVGNIGTNRLAYIGQDLFLSGQQLGQRIVADMPNGGAAVGFIATPGTANIQPRIDGAKAAIQASGRNIKFTSITSGAELAQENTTINAYVLAHKSTLKGIFAVDAGSTQTIGQIIAKYGLQGKVASGGFDLTPKTLSAIKGGSLDFTIDQQPYMQGFLPVLYLYLFNLSGGLVHPPETDTGLTFVTKANVDPYLSTQSRYEGSTTKQKLITHSGAIS
ncbi:MAG TPA: sugar ABC transporter substrate-binding protein [Streptosporangiaceae bacterium]